MTQYLGPWAQLNRSFQWSQSLLTQCMVQNPNMQTVQSVQLWPGEAFSRR